MASLVPLEKAIEDQEHEQVSKLAKQVLQEANDDKEARECLVISYIKLDRYEDALKVIPESMVFEKAYCLYRTNKTQAALDLLLKEKSDEKKFQYLEAQLYYKLENFEKALSIYEKLLKSSDMDEASKIELMTNYCAVKAMTSNQLNLEASTLKQTFELAFNAACSFISNEDYKTAESFLEISEKLCQESIKEEGISEEEAQNELSPILTQKAFVKQKLGKSEEAFEIYQSITKNKSNDEAVKAVASNNIVSIQQEHDLFDGMKKLKNAMGETTKQKLLSHQRRVISFNNALLHFYSNKIPQCRDNLQTLFKEFPQSEFPYLVQAAIILKEKGVAKAIEDLQVSKKKIKEPELISLTLAQLLLSQGDIENAVLQLETITGKLQKYPAALTTLILCYDRAGKSDQAILLLKNLANSEDDSTMEFVAGFYLKLKKGKEAAEIYEKIIRKSPSNMKSLAGLIRAYSYYDPQSAEKYEASLPGLNVVDADPLEAIASKLAYKSYKAIFEKEKDNKQLGKEEKDKETEQNKEKKKKKKKKRTVKDPSAPIDPERWLPLKQRSYYKGKKGKGKVSLKGASQGALVQPNLNANSSGPETSKKSPAQQKGKGKAKNQ